MPKKEENDNNVCQWLECLTQFDTAEDLFNHVCAHHIGRKSAGTLSLECKWTGCRAKASKRDHLTSHCRVHIALKPHVCNICTKAFKRPQDLKKHEKIHTEEHQAQHRINKSTITVPSNDPTRAATVGDPLKAQHGQPTHQQPQMPPVAQIPYPFAFPALAGALPYLFAAQPGQPPQSAPVNQQFGIPGQMSQMDLACLIALQQQLNSQAQAASVLPGMPNGLSAAYAMQLGQQAMSAQALQFLPQGAAAGMYPYGNSAFGFPAAAPVQAQYSSTPAPASVPSTHSHTPAPGQPTAQGGMAASPPSSSSPAQRHSLYPTLPPSLHSQQQQQQQQQHSTGYNPHQPLAHQQPQHPGTQPTHAQLVKAEDFPSPANSARSPHSNYSSSLSPGNVPALSPPSSLTPENSFSPSPAPETEAQRRQRASYGHSSSNSVAGKKRGFEEATGQFLGALANKRFQDTESMGAQLDSLSTFLLTPELSSHALTPPGLGGDESGSGSSSSGSEYGSNSQIFEREEVDTINQLLLSLNQSFDTDLAAAAGGFADGHSSLGLDIHAADSSAAESSQQPRQVAGLPSSGSMVPPQPASLYPSLNGMSASHRPSAPVAYPSLPTSMPSFAYSAAMGHQSLQDPQLRLAKSVAPPTISNDYRPTQYHHIGRLQRAAPASEAPQSIEEQVERELLDADMDVDDDVKDAAAALLMGKSLSRSSLQQLPPIRTAMASPPPSGHDLRLAPIATRAGLTSRLPPIRDILALHSGESDSAVPDSPSSPVASGSGSGRAFAFSPSTSSTSSATSSRASTVSLYPSLASIAAPPPSSRPVSAGGVERLTHRVHKLRLPADADHPVRESDADLSASSDEDDDEGDHPSSSKKSRLGELLSGPRVLVKEEDEDFDHDLDGRVEREASSRSSSATEEEDDVVDEERKPVLEEEDDDDAAAAAAARAALEEHARVIARRKAVIAYLVLHVNTAYRAQLARKSMKDVRRALKKPAAPGPSPLGASSAAAQAIKEESERDRGEAAAVEADGSA